MFSEKTVENILEYTKEILVKKDADVFHNESDVMEAIEVLYKLLMLQDDEGKFAKEYAEQFEKDYFEDVKKASDLFNNEGMLKKLLRVIDMDAWNAGPAPYPGQTPARKWQLGDLYTYFRIKDRYPGAIKAQIRKENNGRFPLSECDPDMFSEDKLCRHYCRALHARNCMAHKKPVSKGTLELMRVSVLLVYLDMCARYKAEITAKYAELQVDQVFNRSTYLQKVIDAYKEQEKRYLTVYWRSISGAAVDKKKITTLVDTDTESKVIKLVGAAGVGKSESMKYAQYHQCKQCVSVTGNQQLLPVRVELIKLRDNLTLQAAMAKELNVLEEKVESILSTYTVTLYLDGYNEILNADTRRKVATDIDDLIQKYDKMKFVISDRSRNTNPRCADKATCYQLEPLDEKQIKEFFEKNTIRPGKEEKDSIVLKGILDNYSERFKWLENNHATPFMLLAVIEMMRGGKAFPSEPTGFWFKYLENLMEREDAMKFDARIKVLKECLIDLVEVLPNESSAVSLRSVRKSFQKSGVADLEMALALVDLAINMRILEAKEEEEEIGWAKPEYFSYFFDRYE